VARERGAGSASDAEGSALLDDVEAIDRVVHEPARLMIMAHLSVLTEADFVYLLNATGLTKGNLGSHIAKLESARYVRVDKRFVGRTPRTVVALTPEGRAALAAWRDSMSVVVASLS
jgi:DNA-binding MarR family transcriptional regulator